MLFAEGFEEAKILSKKMVKLYKLSSEQLSQQDHYDFGMRAVKSVLVMAGGLKRANPALDEDVVLIRAMRDANLPKFLVDDVQLFQAIIQDLFPGVKIPEQACHRRGPAPHPAALAHLTRFRLYVRCYSAALSPRRPAAAPASLRTTARAHVCGPLPCK